MKKAEAKALQEKYGMEILRNPITKQAWALFLRSAENIPELDGMAEKDVSPCAMQAFYLDDEVQYELVCPEQWFDLWGWSGKLIIE